MLLELQTQPWQAVLIATTEQPQYSKTAYRPPAWETADGAPKTYIEDSDGTLWYFDGVIRIDHSESRRTTEHPIQTGANITDHSFKLPSRVSLEVSMSDSMESYRNDQFGDEKRSAQAYQKLLDWANAGDPLTVYTRLNIYTNMVIENISTPDDYKTVNGLKSIVSLKEIMTVSIKTEKSSKIEHVTGLTKSAEKQVVQSTASILERIINSGLIK